MTDIFISYAREDKETAQLLADALEQHGFTVFWDRRIPAGKRFDDYISEQLKAARCVIVVWSPASLHSSWVREEAADGRDRGILVPVRLKDIAPPLGFRAIQAADLVDWQGEPSHRAFKQLLDDVGVALGAPVHVGEAVRPRDPSTEIDVGKERQRAEEQPKRKADEERHGAKASRKAEKRQRAVPLAGIVLPALAADVLILFQLYYYARSYHLIIPFVIFPAISFILYYYFRKTPDDARPTNWKTPLLAGIILLLALVADVPSFAYYYLMPWDLIAIFVVYSTITFCILGPWAFYWRR